MKKIFTLIAVAMMAVSSFAGTPLKIGGGWNGGFTPITPDNAVFDYKITKQWGAAEFFLREEGYTKCTLEFATALSSDFQINYDWKESADAEVQHKWNVVAATGKTQVEVEFADGCNYIEMVSVQNKTAGDDQEVYLHVKKAVFEKANGSKKLVAPSFNGWWGQDLTSYYAGTVSLPDQYMQLVVDGAIGKKDIEVLVEFAEPVNGGIQFCLDYDDADSEWPQMQSGKAIQTVKTTRGGATIKNLGIQRQQEGAMSVTVLRAWLVEENEKFTTTIGSTGYNTVSYFFPLDCSQITGAKAYAVTSCDAEKATLTEVTGVVPARTGLILVGEPGAEVTIPASSATATAPAGNLLVATAQDTTVEPVAGKAVYVLGSKDGENVAFYSVSEEGNSAVVAENKAYLQVAGAPAGAPLYIVINDDPTAISEVATVQNNNVMYNLAGQRVNANTKGIVVMNGKKVVVK